MFWASHVPRPKPGLNCQVRAAWKAFSFPFEDFRKLNRTAAKCGVRPSEAFLGCYLLSARNAKDLADFRKHTDIKLVPPGPMGVLPKVIPSDVIPSFAYGNKSRPSTPITHVVPGAQRVQTWVPRSAISTPSNQSRRGRGRIDAFI